MTQDFLENPDIDADLLTFAGRKRRGIPELVHIKKMPAATDAVSQAIVSALGFGPDFQIPGTGIFCPWLALQAEYLQSLDAYHASIEQGMKHAISGTPEEQAEDFYLETTATDNLYAARKRAVTATRLLMDYLRAAGVFATPGDRSIAGEPEF